MTVYVSKRQSDGRNRWYNVTGDRPWELDAPSRAIRERVSIGEKRERFIRVPERKLNLMRLEVKRDRVEPRSDPETKAAIASGEGLSDERGPRREAAKDARAPTVSRVGRVAIIT